MIDITHEDRVLRIALNRPELEDRLLGFSNAIAEILASPGGPPDAGVPGTAKVGLITISKPIWSYGLEAMSAQLLPPKEGRLRRIAFAQLALPGRDQKSVAEVMLPAPPGQPALNEPTPLPA